MSLDQSWFVDVGIGRWLAGGGLAAWMIWHMLDHRRHLNGRSLVDKELCESERESVRNVLKLYVERSKRDDS